MEDHSKQNIRTQLQKEIQELEAELTQIAARLEVSGLSPKEIASLQDRYEDITLALEALLNEWRQYPGLSERYM